MHIYMGNVTSQLIGIEEEDDEERGRGEEVKKVDKVGGGGE